MGYNLTNARNRIKHVENITMANFLGDIKKLNIKMAKDFRGSRSFIGGPYLMEQSALSYPPFGQF